VSYDVPVVCIGLHRGQEIIGSEDWFRPRSHICLNSPSHLIPWTHKKNSQCHTMYQ